MKTPSVVLVIVVCCGAAFAAGWLVRAPGSGERVDAERSDGTSEGMETSDPAKLDSTATRLVVAQKDLAEEKARHAETARELTELRARVEQGVLAEGAEGDAASKGPRYTFEKVGTVLAAADWKATGESIVKMGPLLVEFAESLSSGQGLPSSIGELQRWNAPLLGLALEAQKGGVPGTGIPGTFGHPALAVNMVHAAMEQAGKPLSKAQAERLGELGRAFVEEDERRLAGYDDTAFQVQKTIDEAALKDRLYAAIDELLTEEQREVLHPAAVRERNGLDIFSSAVLWNAICAPLKFRTTTDLVQTLVTVANQRTKFPAELQPALEDAAEAWTRAFTAEYLDEEPDALFREGLALGGTTGMPAERARVASRHAAAFYRALVERLPVDSPAAVSLRTGALIPVPVKWIEKTD
jgi:hypothetical protein